MADQIIELNKRQQQIQLYLRLIAKNSKIQDTDFDILLNASTFKSIEKNNIIHCHGKIETYARFIVKGIVKVTFYGSESYTFDFREKNDFLCDAVSLLSREKSNFSFETITKCDWIETCIYDLIKSNNGISNAFFINMADYMKRGHDRLEFLRINNAETRYKSFCTAYPNIVKYTKLGDIASYLDITQQSLSRIRKNSA